MLNQIILVGRIVNDLEQEKEETKVTIAMQRPFKNAEGEYDTDFITVYLKGEISKRTAEYCRKGDIIGIKGRMQSTKQEDGSYTQEIIAEKVTFLSSSKNEGKDEKENSNS